ncbi:MAG: DNA mismatch repair protein MutS [SAR202 cluster bacterium]|nr:DNA mismatch repair protein MutS [SAR202 cluster bacterium]|tara:strand:- start:32088 stop:34664 length:2577 start_codon:yes stop_codon:yes gene_type:complete
MHTPARLQYLKIKKQHENELLLFRMGDFYETFDSDAELLSHELDIALTSREMGKGEKIPLAGFPYHSLETYLSKLISKGHHIAICEQTSDPATSKGIVSREVVRIVTPGTIIEESILDKKSNNYLVSIFEENNLFGLSYVDITTGEFATTQLNSSKIHSEISRLNPSEVLIQEKTVNNLDLSTFKTTEISKDYYSLPHSIEEIKNYFKIKSLEPFGCENLPLAIQASGSILKYVKRNRKNSIVPVTKLTTYSAENFMILDKQTSNNLEIFRGGRDNNQKHSLLSVLDSTKTPMGARMLKRWLGQPLLNIDQLEKRLDSVESLFQNTQIRSKSIQILNSISDIERIINNISIGNTNPREVFTLANSLEQCEKVQKEINKDQKIYQKLSWIMKKLSNNTKIINIIKSAISENPPLTLIDGSAIKKGFSIELDTLIEKSKQSKSYFSSLEKRERERTQIKSLKVGYNKVFGYYIEIRNANLEKTPENYIRRQTLVGAERFITNEMKTHESQILNIQENIVDLTNQIFHDLCVKITSVIEEILSTSNAISKLDTICSLSQVAIENQYIKPVLTKKNVLEINDGRHPVVEQIAPDKMFIPNNLNLSNSKDQLIILTGPNMSGKSTYIRQTGVITLLAQIGSFVPASSATIGLVDRIFTRVGLQDDLSLGQSTFMVEMLETASILNHATNKSLIILDEIGRGTSTYDGLAIAQSIAEFIHNNSKLGCRTLFATHYHELTELSKFLKRVANYTVDVSEKDGEIIFLHNIIKGTSNKSYGIHVAKLAGIPKQIIPRAYEILNELEQQTNFKNTDQKSKPEKQLPLITQNTIIKSKLNSIDINKITPIEAINELANLIKLSEKDNDV